MIRLITIVILLVFVLQSKGQSNEIVYDKDIIYAILDNKLSNIEMIDTYALLEEKIDKNNNGASILCKNKKDNNWSKVIKKEENQLITILVDQKDYKNIIGKEKIILNKDEISDWIWVRDKTYTGFLSTEKSPPFKKIKPVMHADIAEFIMNYSFNKNRKYYLAVDKTEIDFLKIKKGELESNLLDLEKDFIMNFYTKVVYPLRAKENGIEGMVKVQFEIKKNGSISNIKIFESRGELLDQATIKALNEVQYFGKIKINQNIEHVIMEFPAKFILL